MPKYCWFPVTVPGVPAAWRVLSRRFGSLPLEKTLLSATEYAKKGYPVSPVTGFYWQKAFEVYQTN